MNLFATAVYATETAAPAANGSSGGAGNAGGGSWMLILLMAATFVIFYVLMVLPQKKRAKEHKKMIDAIQKGDKVLTTGGIIGVVTGVDAEHGTVTLKIGEGAKVDFIKSAIQSKMQ
jgi:preprotein translocase subunit YajC